MFKGSKKIIALIIFIIISLVSTSYVFAYSYLGSGKWASKTIKYAMATDAPSEYSQPTADATAMWTNNTHISFVRDNSSQINVYVYDYGYTGWSGKSFMNPSWDSTFSYGNIQINTYYTANFPDLRRKLIICHEFGHELSLAHSTSYVMMYGSNVWDAYLNNNSLANAPAQDDISGVNNRYP